MATARSVTFQTDKDSLFASAMQIVKDAGYVISETDDAAKKLVYVAKCHKKLSYEHRFEIVITVSGSSQQTSTEAMLSIKAADLLIVPNSGIDVEFENQLIGFVITALKKRFKTVVSKESINNAPGAGGNDMKPGCIVLLSFLGMLATGSGIGCCMLLATLLGR